ncbi:hypothetical protein ACFL2T_01420 [Elusimicrobiota bacterium]
MRIIHLTVLVSVAVAVAACSRGPSGLPLEIVSLKNEIVFDAPDSPRQPYVLEGTRINLKIRNVGNEPISKERMMGAMPVIDIPDFKGTFGPKYVINGGFWNPYRGHGLAKGEVAQVWVMGYFLTAGTKIVSARTESDQRDGTVVVMEQKDCFESDRGEDQFERGWVIGPSRCSSKVDCTERHRFPDMCTIGTEKGDLLRETICLGGNATYRELICENACRLGACLRDGVTPGPLPISLVYPNGGERFRPGQNLEVRWDSRTLDQVSVHLKSKKVRQRGRAGKLALGDVIDRGDHSERSARVTIPKDIASSDDWRFEIIQSDASGTYIVSSEGTITIP